MIGPTIERIERRLKLIEASRTLERITVDEMTRALIHVRLGCEGSDPEDQWSSTRYYAERLLNHLAEMWESGQAPDTTNPASHDD